MALGPVSRAKFWPRQPFNWVRGGALLGSGRPRRPSDLICGGAFWGSDRPRGPGKAFKSVGVFAHIFEGFAWPPDLKNAPKQIRPDCLQVPSLRIRPGIFDFELDLGRPEIVDCWGLGAPAAPKTHPQGGGGGGTPPPAGMVLRGAGAAPTPKNNDVRPAPKPCIKNQSVIGFEYGFNQV